MLSQLPNEWEYKTLRELDASKKTVINPKSHPDETFEYYSIPAYQNGACPVEVQGREILSSKLLLPEKCLLFGKLNPRVEKVWNVNSASKYRRLASTEWLPIVPTQHLDQVFGYFLLWSDWVLPIAKRLTSGSTPSRQRVDSDSFYKIEVPLPPLPEQQAIAQIFSEVDCVMNAQTTIIASAQDLKRAAMRTLFTKGLRGEAQKETEIGPMPKSWEIVKLGDQDIADITLGQSPPSSAYNEAERGLPFYQGKADFGFVHPTTRVWCDAGRKFARAGDIVMSVRAPVGDVNILLEDSVIGRGIAAIRAGSRVDPWFLYFVFIHCKPLIENRATGSTFASINKATLLDIGIPLPSFEEQREIAAILDAIDRKIELHRRKRGVLDELFKSLLHKLMTGEIRVADLDLSALDT